MASSCSSAQNPFPGRNFPKSGSTPSDVRFLRKFRGRIGCFPLFWIILRTFFSQSGHSKNIVHARQDMRSDEFDKTPSLSSQNAVCYRKILWLSRCFEEKALCQQSYCNFAHITPISLTPSKKTPSKWHKTSFSIVKHYASRA